MQQRHPEADTAVFHYDIFFFYMQYEWESPWFWLAAIVASLAILWDYGKWAPVRPPGVRGSGLRGANVGNASARKSQTAIFGIRIAAKVVQMMYVQFVWLSVEFRNYGS